VAEAVDLFLAISIHMLELEQLLAQGCKVAVGRLAVNFESVVCVVIVVAAVGHVVLSVLLFSRVCCVFVLVGESISLFLCLFLCDE